MDKRERPIYKGIFFSEQEWQQVATKMAESDTPNFSAFCREMLLTGKVKHYDFSVIKEISSSLSHISGSINQGFPLFHDMDMVSYRLHLLAMLCAWLSHDQAKNLSSNIRHRQ